MGIVPVPSKEFIYDFAIKYPESANFAVAFDKQESNGNINYQYQIWYNFTNVANYTVFDNSALEGALRDTRIDDQFGVQLLSLMRGIDEAILSTIDASSSSDSADIRARLKAFPDIGRSIYAGNKDSVWNFGGIFLFLPIMLLFVTALASIVREKSLRLRESMEMMGMTQTVYWLSTWIIYAALVAIQSLFLCLFGMAFQFSFFLNTNFIVVYSIFVLYGWAMICLALFLSTLCSRVGTADILYCFILIYIIYTCSIFNVNGTGCRFRGSPVAGHTAGWVIGMFLPFFNYSQLYIDVVMKSSGSNDPLSGRFVQGPGFRFMDLYQHPEIGGSRYGNLVPMPNTHLLFLILDILVWSLLTWYLDNVVPDAYGYRRPFLFFLDSGYWGSRTVSREAVTKMAYQVSGHTNYSLTNKQGKSDKDEDSDIVQERHQTLNLTQRIALRIVNLTKYYKDGIWTQKSKLAVDHICLSFAEGQLLALLGQNGAGKTTTMSMLYGALKPSNGDAYIYGHSISRNMDAIRGMMGVCPQHDILFSDLTGEEHIILYAGLKGVAKAAVQLLANERLSEVRLTSAAHTQVSAFSGGMKRRLSMIIATIGDPKIIIMDEPTTGMDPVHRRHVWSFIEKFKRNRVIILSTHLMEEADTLGDKIAVMAKGKLVAFGTSIHLKNKFGAGYRVSLMCNEKGEDVSHLKEIIPRIVPTARLHDAAAGSLVYQIPSLTNLTNLIRYVEDNPHNLVQGWGITQTTLEEVFLRIITRDRRQRK
ncbi:P-loop containing nucleoside triphosphate hydrolase protein [Syncephalis plumigaleata]|nr:P-loop containing nucleoside triphosphate hydrolase protein [Syncephalis plumigaleata]